MGLGYKGGADHFHSVSENIGSLKAKYGYENGCFGEPGQGKSSSVRNIASEDPSSTAHSFYDELTYGGLEEPLYGKDGSVKGMFTEMADGTRINWRPVSSSPDKSPAVDIDIQYSDDHGDLKTQKIHFVRS